jgi:hypothetical protein
MADVPHPWDAYARLQAELSQSRCVANRTWATEAGLNRILESDPEKNPPTHDEIDRAVASCERRERHRARLQLLYPDHTESACVPEAMLDARQDLRFLRSQVRLDDWTLLCEVAIGREYEVIAVVRNTTANGLRRDLARKLAA